MERILTPIYNRSLKDEKCYLNNYLIENLWDNHNLQRKISYLRRNQNNRE
jgi:hypothetical protein